MPSSIVRGTTDVDEHRQTMRPANTQLLITGRGKFVAEVTKVDLHHLWLQCLQESLPRTWCFENQRFGFWLPTPGSAMRADGVELQDTEIGPIRPSMTHWHRVSGPSQMASMSLPVEDLAGLSITLAGQDLTPRPSAAALAAPPAALNRLQRLHKAARRLAKSAPEIISNANAALGLEQTLVEALFDCIAEGRAREDAASRRRHGTIIKRFLAMAEEHPDEPLYLADVCAEIGVTRRTLHLCCQEYFGMGPKRYLTLRRMHLAKRALRARAEDTTVTEIATRFGFWELGRFAVAYRSLFGESPSALRRNR